MDWLTKEEIDAKYKHVSKHELPYETTIVKIIPQFGIPLSDRWNFLKGLFLITKEFYYFQYNDVCNKVIDTNQDGQP